MINGFSFAKADQPTTTLGNKSFSHIQSTIAQDQVRAYFTKLGYDVSKPEGYTILIKWDRVDRRKFP